MLREISAWLLLSFQSTTLANRKMCGELLKFCPLSSLAVPPRVYPSPPDGNYVVRSGSTVELVCNAEGSPPPAITWSML